MKFAILIISPANYEHAPAFQEVAELLHFGLLALGHDSVVTTTVVPDRLPIVLGSNLLPFHAIDLPANSILYNLEQISHDSPWLNSSLLELFQKHRVWDYSLKNIAYLREMGVVQVQHLPVGYMPELTRIHNKDIADQDIDVLFYGALNKRRIHILEELLQANVKVEAPFGVYGTERDELIARSKVVLNMHYYPSQVFEVVRVSYLLANQKPVVSEISLNDADADFFQAGVAFSAYENLVRTCLHYLALPKKRQGLAETGFNLIRRRNEVDYLRRCLEELN
jgi:hypothetical protein